MLLSRAKKLRDLWYIVARNVFLLTNGVISAVVILLFIFGDVQAGIFLGMVLVINMTLGLAQDIRAWSALEKLQLLTAPHVTRVREGKEELVLTEEIRKDDTLLLKIGDQIPCDGVVLHSESLELNEGLITGESSSLPRGEGERVLAGSIITSGSGTMRVETVFEESRIARMTEGIRSVSVDESPIQKAVGTVVRYSGYVLVIAIFFAVLRGLVMHESSVDIVKHVGALASVIVPQGLVFAMTLLFAYGAAHLFRRSVLLQEVNATEKLGRIKNLCMDKTGTLCENGLSVEALLIPEGGSEETAREYMSVYLDGTRDRSQTGVAVRAFLGAQAFSGTILEALPFSSWRRFGAVSFKKTSDESRLLVVGAAEIVMPQLSDVSERTWLQGLLQNEAEKGKRLLCLAHSREALVLKNLKDISSSHLSLVAVFVLSSELRPGIRDAVEFFQKRGVRIRILSGDHVETVRAIARTAGVEHIDRAVTGAELEEWSEDEFKTKVKNATIFARIFPEQKEKIVEALKDDGFTAMVGDGANDALALRKANLGIAMFEGAPATRQVASVVLTNNSFTALPGGVELADSIIKNAEIFASIFFSFSFTGFFLFVWVSALGYPFPLTPLNMTLVNYFTIGFPSILISYWTIRPAGKTAAAHAGNFLKKVLPFVVWSSLLQVIALALVFSISPDVLKTAPSNFLIVLASIVTGFIFFLVVPRFFRGKLASSEARELALLAVFEAALLPCMLNIPFVLRFFEIDIPQLSSEIFLRFSFIMGVYGMAQYALAKWFSRKNTL